MVAPAARSWIRLVGAVAVVAAALVVSTPAPTTATTIEPFDVRFQTNDNGAIARVRQQPADLRVRPPTACAGGTRRHGHRCGLEQQRLRDGQPRRGHRPVDVQLVQLAGRPAGGRRRCCSPASTGEPGSTGGTGGTATSGADRPDVAAAPGRARLPHDRLEPSVRADASADQAYQQFADVTAARPRRRHRARTGAPTSPPAPGEDRYAGWSLVVVYRDPTLPLRNLTVFDGFSDVGQNELRDDRRSPASSPRSRARSTPGSGWSPTRATAAPRATRPSSTRHAARPRRCRPAPTSSTAPTTSTAAPSRPATPADQNMLGFDIKQLGVPGAIAERRDHRHGRS